MFVSSRRDFFKRLAGGLGGLAATQVPFSDRSLLSWLGNACAFAAVPNLSQVEARYYKKLQHLEVECQLCPRKCQVGDRERGYCGARENKEGTYYTLVYGKPCSLGEWLHRVVQREAPGRVPEPGAVGHPLGGPGVDSPLAVGV